jgi:hypothetical protein
MISAGITIELMTDEAASNELLVSSTDWTANMFVRKYEQHAISFAETF